MTAGKMDWYPGPSFGSGGAGGSSPLVEVGAVTLLGLTSALGFPLMHALQEMGVQDVTARKLVHIGCAHMALLSTYFTSSPMLSALPWTAYAVIITASHMLPRLPFLDHVHAAVVEGRGEDKAWTPVSFYAALAVIAYTLQSSDPSYRLAAAVGLACLSWGDGLAALVPTVLHTKGVQDVVAHSMTMFLASTAAVAVLSQLWAKLQASAAAAPLAISHCVLIGLSATGAEVWAGFAAPSESWENAAIPAAAAACTLFLLRKQRAS